MFKILTKGIIENHGKVLLLKRSEKSKFAGEYWDIPGGKIEFGESPEESLIREAAEETTLKVGIKRCLCTSTGINEEIKKQYISIIYLCDYLDGEVVLDEEHIAYQWVALDEIDNYSLVYYAEDALKAYKDWLKSL